MFKVYTSLSSCKNLRGKNYLWATMYLRKRYGYSLFYRSTVN